MAEDKGYGTWLGILTFGVGMIAGGLIVYIIVSRNNNTLNASHTSSDRYIPSYDAPQVNAVNAPVATMKNKEEWSIKRNKDGRIEGITVHRNVSKKRE